MFNPNAFENSRPDGFGVLEIVEESPASSMPPRRFVPLKRTELTGEVAGPLADLHLTHIYGYTREQCDRTLEAVYRFPLPGDAAVTGVRVRFGDVEITAELKERSAAETDYAEAVKQGRQAALATRESPDVFTLRVAGLQPDQDVVVATDYVQLARPEGPEGPNWTLRIPLTTAPRYVRSDETGSHHADGQPLALLRDPGHRFTLDLQLRHCGQATSPTHRIAAAEESNGSLRVQLEGGEVLPDRDFVLVWQPQQDAARPGLSLLLHDEGPEGWLYFLALVTPPAASASALVPREVVLLVDHSGSMEGAKWQAADWAVTRFLHDLTAEDAFALGLFHSKTRWLQAKTLAAAEPEQVESAVRFLTEHTDSGGTELGVALEQGLDYAALPDERTRHLLIVTDAQVSDAGRILRLADAEARREQRRRISVLCIDSAPNEWLALELADRGGGVAKFLTSSPAEEDITTALEQVMASFGQPILAELRLKVDCPGVQTVGRPVRPASGADAGAIDLGDLPRGRAIWAVGRVKRGDRSEPMFRVTVGGREVASFRADTATLAAARRPALKALFGARRILTLEHLLTAHYDEKELREQLTRLGYDPDAIPSGNAARTTVYAENAGRSSAEALRSLLAHEALDYGLASSETAFVAIRTENGKPVEETVVVSNALPAGWSEDFVHARFLCAAPVDAIYDVAPTGIDAATRSAQGEIMTSFRAFSSPARAPQSKARSASPAARRLQNTAGAGTQDRKLVFAGVPAFQGDEAIVFDTSRKEDRDRLPEGITLTGLEVRFAANAQNASSIGPDAVLLLYVDDIASPRARVPLADLIHQGGVRPLNLHRDGVGVVRILLVDPSSAMAHAAPELEVVLTWQ